MHPIMHTFMALLLILAAGCTPPVQTERTVYDCRRADVVQWEELYTLCLDRAGAHNNHVCVATANVALCEPRLVAQLSGVPAASTTEGTPQNIQARKQDSMPNKKTAQITLTGASIEDAQTVLNALEDVPLYAELTDEEYADYLTDVAGALNERAAEINSEAGE